ncbi:MAG TPA: helix-turn-helix transcriptional regulator, partial [Pseudogracilibacillus sp.]|nr:helix-turn-helix transcriptional regulator [Pseudogracilibacillus sp.]
MTIPKITLEAARTNAGYTLREAAKLIGVSVATLHKWEKDSSSVKV